jgi:hypothetical protein
VVVQIERANVAVLGQLGLTNIREHMAHAQLFATMLLQEHRELAGIKMVGIVGDCLVLGGRDGFRRETVVA